MTQDIPQEAIQQLNSISGMLSFVPTQTFYWLTHCDKRFIGLFTGNQNGKSDTVAMDYVLRILGKHPVEKKNVRPNNPIRTFRFGSQNLPTDTDGNEVKNTQYPAFMRRFPKELIVKDITARSPVVTVKPPEGPNIHVEFVSYNQETQSHAGVQRLSVWSDEDPGLDFFEESIPRLLKADGDFIMTYTPTPGSSGWEFERIEQAADVIYRTQSVIDRIKSRQGHVLPMIERFGTKNNTAVIMASTYDNPTLDRSVIEELMNRMDDEDVIDARVYGLHRQLSGKIFKSFTPRVHVIPAERFIPGEVPHDWQHFRSLDYHESNDWAVIWAARSPNDEVFVWQELKVSPQKYVTLQIARQIALMSRDYKFTMDKIDPLAVKKKSDTARSTVEDMNDNFRALKREGIGAGGYWESWDTKSTKGLDAVRLRLNNSLKVGAPFHNVIVEDGRKVTLPTLWVFNTCHNLIESMKNWRLEEWSSRDSMMTKDMKDKPQQKWSHFCHAVECLLKEEIFNRSRLWAVPPAREPKQYYHFGRGA